MLTVYMGYDARDDLAFKVACASIRRYASEPVDIVPLRDWELRKRGLYFRPYEADPSGQRTDMIDCRPFNTDFSFTRFLAPIIHTTGWAVFMDPDVMLREDIASLVRLHEPNKAVMVVKHDHRPTETDKAVGVQQPYRRKNWSSVMLFNAEACRARLTRDAVSMESGAYLHGFNWLADDEIGELPVRWNWLEGYSMRAINPALVHFTRGTPDFHGYRDVEFAREWFAYAAGLGFYEAKIKGE